jgi:hypothetical protein
MTEAETTETADLHHTTHLAGVKFREGARERLDTLPAGTELTLEPEPENPHDPNALKVMHDGFQVGFIPKPLNVEVLGLIAAGRVTRVTKRDDTGIRISVWFRPEAAQ